MTRDRLVQLAAAFMLLLTLTASGALLPRIINESEQHVLRYTDVSVEGAPPFVAIGTAIGALRGLIVDYLWIKVNAMKEKGLFYEVMADADLITRLQPRFAAVWAFHGHNMAYNISVATHTQQERWEWVNAGIRLVRNKGLRYNPNSLELHRELAFWFAHKIEGVADDAHLYYKREFCKEWHMLLGPPPEDYEQRKEWIKEIADAPETLAAAQRHTPKVADLIMRLRDSGNPGAPLLDIKFDFAFLEQYTLWNEVTQRSAAAKILGIEQEYRQQYPSFSRFDAVAADPEYADAWKTLLAHIRKRVLKDEYNMDPQLMYEYTRDLGPIDWRHGQAHALYWSRRGSHLGEKRVREYDIYQILNNDSQQMQAMQDLARWGKISYDPFSSDLLPGRFPDPRWIDTIDRLFEPFYLKHINVRGAGGERFINFLQNFMGSAVCFWFRAGETQRAQGLLDRLDSLFGSGLTGSGRYRVDLDVFVRNETFDQYQAQPHVAPRDVAASLEYGLKVGILNDRPDILEESLRFANTVTEFFKNNLWNDYVNKFGEGRMADLIGSLEDSAEIAYLQLLTNPTLRLEDRVAIWSATDKVESEVTRQPPVFRARVYDRAIGTLETQLARHELSRNYTVNEAFPKPPGLEIARQFLIAREQQRAEAAAKSRARDPITRQ